MKEKEFQVEMGKAKGLKSVEVERQDFWMGYLQGLRRGYHGKKFGSDEEHLKWWGLADDDDVSREECGKGFRAGFRAGFRCATLGREYCSQNSFFCETCSLVNYGRDCHNNPVLTIAEV